MKIACLPEAGGKRNRVAQPGQIVVLMVKVILLVNSISRAPHDKGPTSPEIGWVR